MERKRTLFDWFVLGIGVAFFAISILTLGNDAHMTFEAAQIDYKPIGQYWYELSIGTYNGIQVLLERYVWPPLWDPVLLSIIQWPVWVLTLPIGIILFVWGRR